MAVRTDLLVIILILISALFCYVQNEGAPCSYDSLIVPPNVRKSAPIKWFTNGTLTGFSVAVSCRDSANTSFAIQPPLQFICVIGKAWIPSDVLTIQCVDHVYPIYTQNITGSYQASTSVPSYCLDYYLPETKVILHPLVSNLCHGFAGFKVTLPNVDMDINDTLVHLEASFEYTLNLSFNLRTDRVSGHIKECADYTATNQFPTHSTALNINITYMNSFCPLLTFNADLTVSSTSYGCKDDYTYKGGQALFDAGYCLSVTDSYFNHSLISDDSTTTDSLTTMDDNTLTTTSDNTLTTISDNTLTTTGDNTLTTMGDNTLTTTDDNTLTTTSDNTLTTTDDSTLTTTSANIPTSMTDKSLSTMSARILTTTSEKPLTTTLATLTTTTTSGLGSSTNNTTNPESKVQYQLGDQSVIAISVSIVAVVFIIATALVIVYIVRIKLHNNHHHNFPSLDIVSIHKSNAGGNSQTTVVYDNNTSTVYEIPSSEYELQDTNYTSLEVKEPDKK